MIRGKLASLWEVTRILLACQSQYPNRCCCTEHPAPRMWWPPQRRGPGAGGPMVSVPWALITRQYLHYVPTVIQITVQKRDGLPAVLRLCSESQSVSILPFGGRGYQVGRVDQPPRGLGR